MLERAFFVFEGGAGVGGVFGGDADDKEGLVDEGVGLRGWCGVQGKGRGSGFGGEKGTGCLGGVGFVGVLRPREGLRRASLRSE
jgi:hypothetical protein